jgi:hypothetical protein
MLLTTLSLLAFSNISSYLSVRSENEKRKQLHQYSAEGIAQLGLMKL